MQNKLTNNVFLCKIFTCFMMYPVDRAAAPLESVTVSLRYLVKCRSRSLGPSRLQQWIHAWWKFLYKNLKKIKITACLYTQLLCRIIESGRREQIEAADRLVLNEWWHLASTNKTLRVKLKEIKNNRLTFYW